MGYEALPGVVLRRTPYNDRHSILRAYTATAGTVTLLASDTQRTPGATRMRALLQPPALVTLNLDMRPGRDVHILRSADLLHPLLQLRTDPRKALAAMFITRVLDTLLTRYPADDTLFHYIADTLHALDDATGTRQVLNAPAAFLLGLLTTLGIAPDTGTYHYGALLDMREGTFRTAPLLTDDVLTASESRLAYLLLVYPTARHRLPLPLAARRAILRRTARYLALHLSPQAGMAVTAMLDGDEGR